MGRNLLILIALIACSFLLRCNERYKGNDPAKDHLVQNLPNRGVVMQFTQSREQVIALPGWEKRALFIARRELWQRGKTFVPSSSPQAV